MQSNHALLETFITLANAKGAAISHVSVTPNHRIRIHYLPGTRRSESIISFLTYHEALSHIHVAYNLKNQHPMPRYQGPKPKAFKASETFITEIAAVSNEELPMKEAKKRQPGLRIV